ncbi:MAG: SAM-dependent methyltransferase, partial [Sedimenticolaceae bacterium]
MISATDSHVLWALLRGQPRGRSHAERLQSFYAPQASRYDEFRERLLQGRRELVADLAPSRGARVIELGAGTGRNLDF